MKKKLCGLGRLFTVLFFGVAAAFNAPAQVYSNSIVGYINQVLQPGNNFIANQLSQSSNTLNVLFNNFVPEGTTFTKWNSGQLQFLPLSTYSSSTGWSINYDLNYGEGALLHAPTAFTNTFVGTVWPGWNQQFPINAPLVSSNGLFLLSCFVPIGPATFHDVVGRAPEDGDFVRIFNSLSQVETTTTFDGASWDHGVPLLAVGQSAFFGLQFFPPVPEPSVNALLAAGIFSLVAARNSLRGKRF
jgi:hypothetical protein